VSGWILVSVELACTPNAQIAIFLFCLGFLWSNNESLAVQSNYHIASLVFKLAPQRER
jgi:hypothetical protein